MVTSRAGQVTSRAFFFTCSWISFHIFICSFDSIKNSNTLFKTMMSAVASKSKRCSMLLSMISIRSWESQTPQGIINKKTDKIDLKYNKNRNAIYLKPILHYNFPLHPAKFSIYFNAIDFPYICVQICLDCLKDKQRELKGLIH